MHQVFFLEGVHVHPMHPPSWLRPCKLWYINSICRCCRNVATKKRKFTMGNVKSSRLSYIFIESLPLLSISRWRSSYEADRGVSVVSLISKQQNSRNKCILSDEKRRKRNQ